MSLKCRNFLSPRRVALRVVLRPHTSQLVNSAVHQTGPRDFAAAAGGRAVSVAET